MSGTARICVVTGSRAEFGLLRPIMQAIKSHPALDLQVVACGSHLLQSGLTLRDVKKQFDLSGVVPMQVDGRRTRADDAEAVGVGVARFARLFSALAPDCVLVLGDRIEAFAAASTAAISGITLAHIHGGDRAEGIADEAMRHAITKLANIHFPATEGSGSRIVRMGEDPASVHVVGSPAIDDLASVEALSDDEHESLGAPRVVVLFHPVGRGDEQEASAMETLLDTIEGQRSIVLAPNADPGCNGILEAARRRDARLVHHMPRARFLGLLKRIAADSGGLLIGNSSCGLIEAAAIPLRVIDIGDRQRGRERGENVVHCDESAESISAAMQRARTLQLSRADHPYGDGRAGSRIASILAGMDLATANSPRKIAAY